MAIIRKIFPSLSKDLLSESAIKKSIAIVTTDIKGPIRNGGVGTANAAIADCLVADGHAVTILFVSRSAHVDAEFHSWQLHYSELGIKLLSLPEPYLNLEGLDPARLSYAVYLYLKTQKFNIVHFPDMHGLGFYSTLAKKLDLAFQTTKLCIVLHGPTIWSKGGNHELLATPDDLLHFYLERKSVEMADTLIAPSQHIANWALSNGWNLPPDTFVEQLPISRKSKIKHQGDKKKYKEIVFFGRLETRKGIVEFCDALDQMAPSLLLDKTVTFLGANGTAHWEPSAQYLNNRGLRWSFKWQIFSNLGQEEALAYLCARDVLVVIPSLEESMGYTVVECLCFGIPFIASRIPSFLELIDKKFHNEILFDRNPEGLCEKLSMGIRNGIPVADFQNDISQTSKNWAKWHSSFKEKPRLEQIAPSRQQAKEPLVTVCVTHRNRPQFLNQCIDSLLSQQYQNIEIILMDDASDTKAAKVYLKYLDSEFAERKWKIVTAPKRSGPCVLRNQAARMASGEFLLFMDDDNIAKPEEIATFVHCAKISGADILTCPFDRFIGSRAPMAFERPLSRWLPVGDALGLCLFYNLMGDMNFFIKRDVFLELGGLNEVDKVGSEDAEFLARAALKDYKMIVVPEALFWYRTHEDNFSDSVKKYESFRNRISPFYGISKNLDLQQLISFSLAMWYRTFPDQPGPSNAPLFSPERTNILGGRKAFSRRLFLADKFPEFSKLTSSGNLRLKQSANALSWENKGAPGAIHLPKLNFKDARRMLVEIEIVAINNSFLYASFGADPAENAKTILKKPVNVGYNKVEFVFESLDFKGELQVIPAMDLSPCAIRKLEILSDI